MSIFSSLVPKLCAVGREGHWLILLAVWGVLQWMYHQVFLNPGSMCMESHLHRLSPLCKGTAPSEPHRACTSHVYVLRVSGVTREQTQMGNGFYPFWVQATKVIKVLGKLTLSQVAHESYAPQSTTLFPGMLQGHSSSHCPCISSVKVISDCDPPGGC